MSDRTPAVTVMIVSKNRRDDLRKAVASAFIQPSAVEVLVIDDGSTDGSTEMVRGEFPHARLIRHEESRGLVVRRNEGVALAAARIVISIDDDAIFTTGRIAAQVLASFDRPEIGAVAIPYADINRSPEIRQHAPRGLEVYVTDTFIGTAHAIRRDVFLALGGYREQLFHQGEEADYCIRMLAAGYVVRLGSGDPIHHFESPRRDFRRMDHYGPRNAILFAWQNVPLPQLLLQMPMTIAGVLRLTLQPGRFATRLRGVLDGLAGCGRFERTPVPERVFRLWRRLRGAALPVNLADIESELASRA